MKKSILLLLFVAITCQFAFGQDDNQSKTLIHLDLSYTNPFQQSNNFGRIGSILGLSGGLTYELEDDKFIGFDISSSVFFPNGGGDLSSPQLLPQARFKFAQKEKLWTEIIVGALYNPSSLGFEVDMSYKIDKWSNQKGLWSIFANGVSQTFDIPANELRNKAPVSWLGTFGVKYIKPLKNDLAIIVKPGIGIRGDSDTDIKFVANGAVIIAWKYLSVVTAYTNKVPQREFPSYIVSSIGFDIAKFINEVKPKKKDKFECHDCILKY